MSIETLTNLIVAWCGILTFGGGGIAWAERVIRRRIQRALKIVEDDLSDTKKKLDTASRSYVVVRIYARRLYDTMLRASLDPPEPPAEFYE